MYRNLFPTFIARNCFVHLFVHIIKYLKLQMKNHPQTPELGSITTILIENEVHMECSYQD